MIINKQKARVILIKDLAKDVRLIRFKVDDNFSFIPGQFISIIIPSEREMKRSYSVCSDPEERYIEICFKRIKDGPGTKYLYSLKMDDNIEFIGPIGLFPVVKDMNKNASFISTGTAISPFKCLIPYLLKIGFKKRIRLFAGFREEDSILFEDDFKDLSLRYQNFEYYPILSNPKNKKEQGHVQDLLMKNIDENINESFYICGVNEMIKDVKNILLSKNIISENIHTRGFG